MQLDGPDTATVDLATCVYLDLETTGLGPEDEVVAIGIVDPEGAVLLDTLVRPQHLDGLAPGRVHPRHQS